MLVSAGRVVTPARVFAPGWLLVEGERIADVGPGEPPRPPDVDLPDATLVPGFVDAHAHGGGGRSFDGGDPEGAAAVARTHRAHGTTSMMAWPGWGSRLPVGAVATMALTDWLSSAPSFR